jgi:hypothetical protein
VADQARVTCVLVGGPVESRRVVEMVAPGAEIYCPRAIGFDAGFEQMTLTIATDVYRLQHVDDDGGSRLYVFDRTETADGGPHGG